MCYWTVHALNILGAPIPAETKTAVTKFLKTCEDQNGGYGGTIAVVLYQINEFPGGPGQYAHLATTYAAVMCLVSLKTEEALESIDL